MAATSWIEVFQLAAFLLFVVFVIGGAALTTIRLARYIWQRDHVPLILWRDVLARNGLAIPFTAILAVRVLRDTFGWDTSELVTSPWWVLSTSLPAVIGAGVYLYFEIFIIERGQVEKSQLNHIIDLMERAEIDSSTAATILHREVIALGAQVNGRLSELLELTGRLARAEGVIEGQQAERERAERAEE